MEPLPFIKMHGLGNDFVVIDGRVRPVALDSEWVRAVSDRRTGVGCDQLVLIETTEAADVRLSLRNADGGLTEACGNATRCIAGLVMAETGRGEVTIETDAGLLPCTDAGDGRITVDMGVARTEWRDIPLARAADTLAIEIGDPAPGSAVGVNVGNPHAVFFVDDAEAVDLARIGPLLEHDAMFPERVNVEVAHIRGPGENPHARLGARHRRHAGLRHRRLRDAGRRRAARSDGARGRRRGRRRHPAHRLARGWPRHDDWPVVDQLRRRVRARGEPMNAEVITFGCRLNAYESEVMRDHAAAAGVTDTIIVNTCAVTAEAERQARQAIRRARRRSPHARIVVTGCAAQIDPDAYAAMPEVDRVLGNAEKLRPRASPTSTASRCASTTSWR